MSDPSDVLAVLRDMRVNVVDRENLAVEELDVARSIQAGGRDMSVALADLLGGFTGSQLDWMVAHARDVSGAEIRFAAAVDARMAVDRLSAELEGRSRG